MDVVLIDPILISIDSAKLVVEDNARGTIEFTIFDQPVRLNIESTSYAYDIDIAVDDRVKTVEIFGALAIDSEGIVQKIIPDNTYDRAEVLFDVIFPDQILKPIEAHIVSASATLLIEVPLRILEKI